SISYESPAPNREMCCAAITARGTEPLPPNATASRVNAEHQKSVHCLCLSLRSVLSVDLGERMRGEEMTDNDPAVGPGHHVNFDAPAILRKWPSFNGQRRIDSAGPYLLLDGTLDECIREFMAKPGPLRHL